MLQCINVKLNLEFAIKLQAVYLRGTTYLRTPLFGMIPVVTLFVVCAGAVGPSVRARSFDTYYTGVQADKWRS